MSAFVSVGYFLISLLFSFVLFILWVRMALRFFRVSYLHPVANNLYQLSDRLVQPVQRLLKSNTQPATRIDWACLVVIIAACLIKFILLGLMVSHQLLPLSYLFFFVLFDLIIQPCNLLFYIILIRVIMSWINPEWSNPVADLLRIVSDPVLKLARNRIPDIAGIDFSPLIVLVILEVITLFLRASLPLHLV